MKRKITIDEVIPEKIYYVDECYDPIIVMCEYAEEKYGKEYSVFFEENSIPQKWYSELDENLNEAVKNVIKEWIIKHHLEPDFEVEE